jgi:hypothetical protein
MDLLQLRVIERVLAVVIGGLSIYLGYRLFALAPSRPASRPMPRTFLARGRSPRR